MTLGCSCSQAAGLDTGRGHQCPRCGRIQPICIQHSSTSRPDAQAPVAGSSMEDQISSSSAYFHEALVPVSQRAGFRKSVHPAGRNPSGQGRIYAPLVDLERHRLGGY